MISGGIGSWLYNLVNAMAIACSSGSSAPNAAPKTLNPLNEFLGRMDIRESNLVIWMQQLAERENQLKKDAAIVVEEKAAFPPVKMALSTVVDEKQLRKDDKIGEIILSSIRSTTESQAYLVKLEKENKVIDKTKLLQLSELNRAVAFENLLLVNKVRMALLVWRAVEDVVAIESASSAADILLYEKLEGNDQRLELLLSETEAAVSRCKKYFSPVVFATTQTMAKDHKSDAKSVDIPAAAGTTPALPFNPMTWLIAEIDRQVKSLVQTRETIRQNYTRLKEANVPASVMSAADFFSTYVKGMSGLPAAKKVLPFTESAIQQQIASTQSELNAWRKQLIAEYKKTGDSNNRKNAYEKICQLSDSIAIRQKELLLEIMLALTAWRKAEDVATKMLINLSPEKLKQDLQELIDRRLFEKIAIDVKNLLNMFNQINRDIHKCMADVQTYIKEDLETDILLTINPPDENGAVELTTFTSSASSLSPPL